MAIISLFYGIIISMYFFGNRRHNLPHIHVKFQDQEAVVSIPGGEILEGSLSPNKFKLVQAWIEIHQDDLLADWELASAGESVFRTVCPSHRLKESSHKSGQWPDNGLELACFSRRVRWYL